MKGTVTMSDSIQSLNQIAKSLSNLIGLRANSQPVMPDLSFQDVQVPESWNLFSYLYKS